MAIKYCQACLHTRRAAIDDMLLKGCSVRQVAREVGLGKSSIYRHKMACVLHTPATEVREVRSEIVTATVDVRTAGLPRVRELEALHTRLRQMIEKHESNPSAVLAIATVLLKVISEQRTEEERGPPVQGDRPPLVAYLPADKGER